MDVTLSMRRPQRTRGTPHSPFPSAMQVSCIANIYNNNEYYIYILENSNAWASIAPDACVDAEGVPACTPKTIQNHPAYPNAV